MGRRRFSFVICFPCWSRSVTGVPNEYSSQQRALVQQKKCIEEVSKSLSRMVQPRPNAFPRPDSTPSLTRNKKERIHGNARDHHNNPVDCQRQTQLAE